LRGTSETMLATISNPMTYNRLLIFPIPSLSTC
jgi:hypothetical protein